MKIAIDASPLSSGHSVRGVGFYLLNLKKSLVKYFPENEYLFFNDESEIKEDIELVHYPFFDPFSATLNKSHNKPIIVTVHDLIPIIFKDNFPSGIKGTIRWNLQKRNLKKVDRIITDSHCSKDDIEKIIKYPGNKIDVIYLSAGEDYKKIKKIDKKRLLNKYNLPEKFMLYVGDATWNKNLPNLIKAVGKTEYTLAIVGKAFQSKDYDKSNPWNKSLYEAQVLSEGESKIKVLGYVSDEDLVRLYNLASLLILPSIYEGFGLPVVEAMKCGCPVVTTKAGSLEEVSDSAAYFIDPLDINSIITGINDVMGDEALRKALSKKGLEWADKFSWKKTAKETIESYEKVLSIQEG